MNPPDIGLPRKFPTFRPGQLDAILAIASSPKRFSLVSAPTGSGKSIIYTSVSRILESRTLILTSSRGLQQQLSRDFAPIGLADIRGQNNYICVAMERGGELADLATQRRHYTCDEGPCHFGIHCSMKREEAGCAYYDAVRRAAESNLVVTNYSYWMTANRYSDPDALGKFDLLVLDEAHSVPDILADFCSVRVSRDDARFYLDSDLPSVEDGMEAWSDWAAAALPTARKRLEDAIKVAKTSYSRGSALIRKLTSLHDGVSQLAQACMWRRTNAPRVNVAIPGSHTDWVAERTSEGLLFSPVWAHAYAEEYLFRGIPRVILTSAVLQRATGKYLGIGGVSTADWFEYTSAFDPSRRTLTYIPTTTVDRHMTDGQVRIWLNRIDSIVDGRLDRKGIIHTRSYDRARVIMERSRHRGVMISHTTRTTRDAVEKFKSAPAPAVLVSPSVEEGFDFPGDLCRYQILAKVPFVDARGAVIQARAKTDKTYLNYLTAMSIIQQVGRGTRAADDFCESYIIDDHMDWFWSAGCRMNLFPRWFKLAYRKFNGVPPAGAPKLSY